MSINNQNILRLVRLGLLQTLGLAVLAMTVKGLSTSDFVNFTKIQMAAGFVAILIPQHFLTTLTLNPEYSSNYSYWTSSLINAIRAYGLLAACISLIISIIFNEATSVLSGWIYIYLHFIGGYIYADHVLYLKHSETVKSLTIFSILPHSIQIAALSLIYLSLGLNQNTVVIVMFSSYVGSIFIYAAIRRSKANIDSTLTDFRFPKISKQIKTIGLSTITGNIAGYLSITIPRILIIENIPSAAIKESLVAMTLSTKWQQFFDVFADKYLHQENKASKSQRDFADVYFWVIMLLFTLVCTIIVLVLYVFNIYKIEVTKTFIFCTLSLGFIISGMSAKTHNQIILKGGFGLLKTVFIATICFYLSLVAVNYVGSGIFVIALIPLFNIYILKLYKKIYRKDKQND